MAAKPRLRKLYTIHWYRGDWCYRTTMGCPWAHVLEMKKLARTLGDTIKHEFECYVGY